MSKWLSYGMWKLYVIIAVIVVAFLVIVFVYVDWRNDLNAIDDPIQKGLAWVALAIVFHALFGSRDVTVKVETETKEN